MASKDFDFGEEFQATPETAETHELNESAVKFSDMSDASDKQMYMLANGSQGSRAAYIREMFLEDNFSRKEIAEKTGLPYRVVYSATVNMVNEAEPAGRGRAVTNSTIKVYGINNTLIKLQADGTCYDATTGEPVDTADVKDMSRNDWIKEQVEAGVSRGEIAKILDLSYGVVYNLTKDQDGTRVKYDIELEDGTVISRSAYIRQLFAEGQSRSDIAKTLDVPYSVIWQATKTEKNDSDKFLALVEQLRVFKDKAVSLETFEDAMATLELVEIRISDADLAEAAHAEASEE